MDKKKILNICLIVAAGIVYLALSAIIGMIFAVSGWPVSRDYGLTYPEMLALALAGLALLLTYRSQNLMHYLDESVAELLKVTYPTPKKSAQSALVVVFVLVAAMVVIWAFDAVWTEVTAFVLQAGA